MTKKLKVFLSLHTMLVARNNSTALITFLTQFQAVHRKFFLFVAKDFLQSFLLLLVYPLVFCHLLCHTMLTTKFKQAYRGHNSFLTPLYILHFLLLKRAFILIIFSAFLNEFFRISFLWCLLKNSKKPLWTKPLLLLCVLLRLFSSVQLLPVVFVGCLDSHSDFYWTLSFVHSPVKSDSVTGLNFLLYIYTTLATVFSWGEDIISFLFVDAN